MNWIKSHLTIVIVGSVSVLSLTGMVLGLFLSDVGNELQKDVQTLNRLRSVNAVNKNVTVQGVKNRGPFVLYRRIFGDSTGDGYVGAADLQEFGDIWLKRSAGEFPDDPKARFHNYNKNTLYTNQIIDAGDLQVFGDNWMNGTAPPP